MLCDVLKLCPNLTLSPLSSPPSPSSAVLCVRSVHVPHEGPLREVPVLRSRRDSVPRMSSQGGHSWLRSPAGLGGRHRLWSGLHHLAVRVSCAQGHHGQDHVVAVTLNNTAVEAKKAKTYQRQR